MSAEGWNAEFFYQDGDVLMAIVEIDKMGTFFRVDGSWEPSMPLDMDLSDAEVVSVRGEDLAKFMQRYDNNDDSLADDLASYSEREEG